MGLGNYPLVSLSEARESRTQASKLLLKGIDPIEEKKRLNSVREGKRTFEIIAHEFIEMRRDSWSNDKHIKQWYSTLEMYAFPYIGHLTIPEISTKIIKNMLTPIWKTKSETATRVRSRVENVIDYAIALDESDKANPASLKIISKVLPPIPKSKRLKHFNAMPYLELPKFWKELNDYSFTGASALKLTILTALRTNEAIGIRLNEIEGNVLVIPADRMKSNREHRVPLCDYVLNMIDGFAVRNEYLFSSPIKEQPLSNMAMLKFLKDELGYPYTVHGFRSSFRDWVSEETDFDIRLAETSLAHVLQDKTEASYARGDLLEKRRELMTAWCEYVTN